MQIRRTVGPGKQRERNQRKEAQWREQRSSQVYFAQCHAAREQQRKSARAASAVAEWDSRCTAATCQRCGAAGTLQPAPTSEERRVTFITLECAVRCPAPRYRCSVCGDTRAVNPVLLDCWGATPGQPQTFYCQRLMQWADQLAKRGQLAMEGSKQAAEAVFRHNGCSPPPAAFKSFNDALRHWRHVQHAASSYRQLGIAEIAPGASLGSWL